MVGGGPRRQEVLAPAVLMPREITASPYFCPRWATTLSRRSHASPAGAASEIGRGARVDGAVQNLVAVLKRLAPLVTREAAALLHHDQIRGG